jgi:hypothetical protein
MFIQIKIIYLTVGFYEKIQSKKDKYYKIKRVYKKKIKKWQV